MNNNGFLRKIMKIRGFLVIAIIITLSLIQLIINPKPFDPLKLPSPMVTYEGQYVSFVIQYPESWSFFETPKGDHGDKEVIAVINVNLPTVVIARKEIEPLKLDSAVAWGLERASRCDNFNLVAQKDYVAFNTSGTQLDYTCTSYVSPFSNKKETAPCRDYYTMIGSYAYQLKFCASESQWQAVIGVFEMMIDSFYVINE